MISCLEDAIDVILQDPLPSTDQLPAAFMALVDAGFQRVDAGDMAINLSAFVLTESVPDLPTVDILTDSRIWIALDEGCNATCHGPIWAANVEEKLNAFSLCFPWIHKIERTYTGVGKLGSTGKRRLPAIFF